MVPRVTMRSAPAASSVAAAASAKKRKKGRRALSTPRSGSAVGGDAPESGTGGSGGATRDWPNLPVRAVNLILKALLPSLVDALCLGGVCKGWRRVFEDKQRLRRLIGSLSGRHVSSTISRVKLQMPTLRLSPSEVLKSDPKL